MARNIEIKARISSIEALTAAVIPLADHGPEVIEQDDTFFHCAAGRLKLRVFSHGKGELIFYQRTDLAGPRASFYQRTMIDDPASLRATLGAALGIYGRVRKRRTLFLIGRTRVHLDQVEGLGNFLEFEVVLAENDNTTDGVTEANALMESLGITQDSLVDVAYMDLLNTQIQRA